MKYKVDFAQSYKIEMGYLPKQDEKKHQLPELLLLSFYSVSLAR